jgi:uncharacterized protein HemY
MLHLILKITIGIILFFAILYLVLNLLFLITSKEYRKWFWEESVRRAKEDERKRRAKKPYWTERQYKRYLRTGIRNHLVYDYEDEEDDDE